MVTRLFGSIAMSAGLIAPLIAVDEVGHENDKSVDFYGSLGLTVAPEIEESASGAGGSSLYKWQDAEDSYGQRLAVGHLICKGGPQGGWNLGVEIAASTTDITPRTYEVGGLSFANTSSSKLRYTTGGALIHFGYQFGSEPEPEEISAFFYIAPFIGGGAAWAQSELGGTSTSENGLGYYVEGGLRFGFALAEKHWVLGFMIDGVVGTSRVKIDFGGSNSSELSLDRLGVGGALFMGYRL